MSILDLHEDDLISAAAAAPPVAPRKQDPSFSVWGVVRGLGKSVPAGVSGATGSAADILNAYGSVTAATGTSAGGMFSTGTADQKKQRDEAAKRLREQGPDYRSEAGSLFRGVAKDYMPDPLTAHGAEQAVAEFGRVATKAITAGVVLGPLAGAALAGAEEGFTASDKLADQGVDLGTRTKVGAVTGVVTAAGFALPVAGKTVAKTVGLAVAGGPASFVAQTAATREILQNADYSQLADQYDPFDPVGLALSTLVPLGFGAVAMRAGARRAAAAGKPVPEVAPSAPPEVVDAARVQLLRETSDAARVTPPEDFAGAQAHDAAVGKALEQLASGERVEVAQALEITPEQRDANFKAWFGESKVVDEAGKPLVVYHGTAGDFDAFDSAKRGSGIGDDGGTEGAFFTSDPANASTYAGEVVFNRGDGAAAYAEGQRGQVMASYLRLDNPLTVERGASRDPEVLRAAREAGHDGVIDPRGDYVVFNTDGRVKSAIGNSGRFDPDSPSLTDPLVQITQRMAASLEPIRAELEALRAQVEQQDAQPLRAADDAPPPKAADEAAAPAAQPARFDIDALARQAGDLLSNGKSPAEVIGRMEVGGQRIAPELQNMLVALSEFGRRIPELVEQFRALEAGNRGAPVTDLIADTVERMRAGQPPDAGPAKASPLQARLDAEIVGKPDALDVKMPTEFDAQGKVSESITAREYLDAVKAEAAQEAADANLLQVAANCFLMNGA